MRFWYSIGYCGVALFNKLFLDFEFRGAENIPQGGCLVVGNHASFLDPTTIASAIGKETHFLARKTLFRPSWFGWLLRSWNVVPVDQDGADTASLRRIIRLLQLGQIVLLFPEGTRTLDGTLQPGKAGAGLIACKAGVPIVPARIFGSFEVLPRGAKRLGKTPVRVVIGKPFLPPAELCEKAGKEGYGKLAARMMEEISKLSWEN